MICFKKKKEKIDAFEININNFNIEAKSADKRVANRIISNIVVLRKSKEISISVFSYIEVALEDLAKSWYGRDNLNSIKEFIRNAKYVIKDWYHDESGKYILNIKTDVMVLALEVFPPTALLGWLFTGFIVNNSLYSIDYDAIDSGSYADFNKLDNNSTKVNNSNFRKIENSHQISSSYKPTISSSNKSSTTTSAGYGDFRKIESQSNYKTNKEQISDNTEPKIPFLKGVIGLNGNLSGHLFALGGSFGQTLMLDKHGNIMLANTLAVTAQSDIEVSLSAGPIIAPKSNSVMDLMGTSVEAGLGFDAPVPVFPIVSAGGGYGASISSSNPSIIAHSFQPSIGIGFSPIEVTGGVSTTTLSSTYNIFTGKGIITNPILKLIGIDAIKFDTHKSDIDIKWE